MSAGVGPAPLAELGALAADPRLRELGSYVPPLSLLGAFGMERNEVAHSRALARLLAPGRHRQAYAVLGSLLREVAKGPGLDGETAEALRAAAAGPRTRVAVHTERMLIDVVVEVSTARGTVVLAVENKLDAGEQPGQLARYQASLARAYPSGTAVLAFLTPTGRDPTTADRGAAVPVVTLGWDAVLRATGEARGLAPPGSRDKRSLSEFEEHVREDVLGEARDDGVRALARGLWREHGRALRFALENRPRLEDVRDEYVGLLSGRYPDARFDYYPASRGDLKEIKMTLRSFDERGFPFTFMLGTNEEDGRPRVRALIWKDSYRRNADSLAAWAARTDGAGGPDIDGNFPRIGGRGWGANWHKIFPEEDHPEDATLEEDAFDSETARAAFDAVVELVERLRPRVEDV